MRPAISCQNLSTLTKVTRLYDSPQHLMASSCENLSPDSTKPAILTRKKLNLKIHSELISDKDSGFGSFRSDNNNDYEEKSAAKYPAPTEKCKRRERRKIPLAPMGVLAPHLRTLDGPLVPPSTRAEIFRRTCLGGRKLSKSFSDQFSRQIREF
jgi:hypothetical protein